MDNFTVIQQKLNGFIRKYYTNELIKGSILFLAFGFLYFIFTLFIENFLWLQPTARTVLFWLFIAVEFVLLFRYILFPIFKLFGISKGISLAQASKIIGQHFAEIDDKLLNVLQLHESNSDSELALASIEQKAKNLQPIPFRNAINFKSNSKYLKFLAIPFFIWLSTYITGKNKDFNKSYNRIIHHQQAFVPPAPFHFQIDNTNLQVIEGTTLKLNISTVGDVVPEEALIYFNDESYFLNMTSDGHFFYTFENLTQPLDFYLKANKVQSEVYHIRIIPTPKIQQISMFVDYPAYVHKKDEKIKNTGNITVPAGTHITWDIATDKTDSLFYVTEDYVRTFKRKQSRFTYSKPVYNSYSYQLVASNKYLEDYEKLPFAIEVIKDAYPEIVIKTDIDSLAEGKAQFFGNLSDDYGISKLDLVYYDKKNPTSKIRHTIEVPHVPVATFYYIFPDDIQLKEGIDYEFYFEVFDNDAVNKPKSTKSKTFSYHKNTHIEDEQLALQKQKEDLDNITKNLEKQRKNSLNLSKLQQQLQSKPNLQFNDVQKLNKLINRQEQYQQMMLQQTQDLEKNLENKSTMDNPTLEEKKEDIKRRIEEVKELAKKQKLLDELKRMADKLSKEDLLDEIKKLSKNNKNKERSLERLLELTKRFYVEQKAEQIRQKLDDLAHQQDKLAEAENKTSEQQKELNKEFEEVQKELKDLEKENKDLKEPMDIDPQEEKQESIKDDMDDAEENLQKNQPQAASPKQKSAAKKMKEMAKTMQMQMAANAGTQLNEDVDMLRAIIENLISFSYKQESLMKTMASQSFTHPSFSKNLREQNTLKTFFEHIDDSLYVLSLRQPKIFGKFNTYLSDAHYYLDESLSHYADNQYNKANSDQHFVMKAANDLAVMLSNILDHLQSSMSGMGSGKGMGNGKGSNGSSFGLPDIIKKQSELLDKLSKGQKNGNKPGENGESPKEGEGDKPSSQSGGKDGNSGFGGEKESQALYEIYQQQARLRQAVEQQLMDKLGSSQQKLAKDISTEMEELEKLLLEKGISNEVLDKMNLLKHELLKLKDASLQQNKDNKRQSKTSQDAYNSLSPKQLEFYKKYYNQNDILNKQALPLRTEYIQKVEKYFKKNHD